MDDTLLKKKDCIKWLTDHGLSTSGTLDELYIRINKFKLYPFLTEKLKRKAERIYVFKTFLNPTNIPPLTAPWTSDDSLYPYITSSMFKKYASNKREGSLGQQQKGYIFLTSRKIVAVKALTDFSLLDTLFVRGLIKKSYGEEICPAVILFKNNFPQKAYCEFPVGVNGYVAMFLHCYYF